MGKQQTTKKIELISKNFKGILPLLATIASGRKCGAKFFGPFQHLYYVILNKKRVRVSQSCYMIAKHQSKYQAQVDLSWKHEHQS